MVISDIHMESETLKEIKERLDSVDVIVVNPDDVEMTCISSMKFNEVLLIEKDYTFKEAKLHPKHSKRNNSFHN